MKQNKQMYVAPQVELIEMQAQGVLCASNPEIHVNGNGLRFDDHNLEEGAWVL